MLVFSTNLDPADLVEEAFLRRIQTKIFVENVTPDIFDRIFEGVLEKANLPSDPDCAAYLRQRCVELGSGALRACYPRDIYALVSAVAKYEGNAVRITRAALDRAADLYFGKSRPAPPLPERSVYQV
jgi:hypothetical protein